MTIEKLIQLRKSNEAPFDHEAYTVWLHNKIIEAINMEIWHLSNPAHIINSNQYNLLNKVKALPSMQKIE